MWKIIVVLVAVLIAVFLRSDSDLPLQFLPYNENNAFVGQVVWIAGASSGIGAALAADMVKAGAKVIISARRVGQLEDVAEECAKFGLKPFVLEMDMTDYESQKRAFDKVIEKFGHVDSLVLNAGQSQRNTALETPMEVTENLMRLNFFSYVTLTKLVAPLMVARNQGQV